MRTEHWFPSISSSCAETGPRNLENNLCTGPVISIKCVVVIIIVLFDTLSGFTLYSLGKSPTVVCLYDSEIPPALYYFSVHSEHIATGYALNGSGKHQELNDKHSRPFFLHIYARKGRVIVLKESCTRVRSWSFVYFFWFTTELLPTTIIFNSTTGQIYCYDNPTE